MSNASPVENMEHSASKSERDVAIHHLRAMMEFAYQQGFHELGYDPLAVLLDTQEVGEVSHTAGGDCIFMTGKFPGVRQLQRGDQLFVVRDKDASENDAIKQGESIG